MAEPSQWKDRLSELATSFATLHADVEKGHLENQRAREEIETERKAWQQEKEEIAKSMQFKGKIKLDIGGKVFATSDSSILKDPDSMLGRMFSGRHALEKDEDGCYFIDRDGEHFRYILNYLRNIDNPQALKLPTNKTIIQELLVEAEYYQLNGLIEVLNPPGFECKFETVDDKNGIMYTLGTGFGTETYKSPVERGTVKVTSIDGSVLGEAVGHPDICPQATGGWCTDATQKWFTIELANGGTVSSPTSFSLSHSGTCCAPCHFTLEGRSDGHTWITLHTNSTPFASKERKNFGLPQQEGQFDHFRIKATGSDASGGSCCCFHVKCFEVYGKLHK
eukprot:m.65423 g.65423  ORF g.65423 m.65423 type:complete len:336 (-) comp23556_c1_seq1:305-1312(-)